VTDTDVLRILAALVVLLTCVTLAERVCVRLRQPPVIGDIVAGLLLGPSLLGLFAPAVGEWLFPRTGPVASALSLVYQLGLLLIMFLTGTQMRRGRSRGDTPTVAVVTVAGMLVPFLAGLGLAAWVPPARLIGPAGDPVALTLVVAVAVAITSIPVISRIMHDLGLLRTRLARIVLSVAIAEDIVLNVVLAVALGLVSAKSADGSGLASLLGVETSNASIAYHAVVPVVFFAGAVLLATLGSWWRRRRAAPAGSAGVGAVGAGPHSVTSLLVLLLGLSGLCVFLGIAPMFGAFVAGLFAGARLAPDTDPPAGAPTPVATVGAFASAFFIPLYFAAVGLRLDLAHALDLPLTVLFVGVACVVKAGSVYVAARCTGNRPAMAVDLAVALNARGGPGIVLASLAYDAGIVNATFFTTLVLTAVLTSLIAGSWLERTAHRHLAPMPSGPATRPDADPAESVTTRTKSPWPRHEGEAQCPGD
jgi:Kef-type K+ transport system membrane component KefB